MTMCSESSRLELELDPHALPHSRSNLPLRLTVRKSGPENLDHVAELATDHAEEKNHALFVDRSMLQTAEMNEIAIEVALDEGPSALGLGLPRGPCTIGPWLGGFGRSPCWGFVRADSRKQLGIPLRIELCASCSQDILPAA